MNMRIISRAIFTAIILFLAENAMSAIPAPDAPPPNIVYILADDLGYGDLGCYGQRQFATPRIDSLAADGLRFTQHYAGSAVCAPSRCSLLTGFHSGHSEIRSNKYITKDSNYPLSERAVTVADLLRKKGYANGCFGKWGLGGNLNEGDPLRHGFDEFFGYYSQDDAPNYFPTFLFHSGRKIELDGKTYSHDLIVEKALDFIRRNKDKPFFCYLPVTIPHADMQAPEDDVGPWREKFAEFENVVVRCDSGAEVRNPVAAFPAMMTKLDESVGALIDLLRELDLEDDTLVFFSSDNGPHTSGGHRSLEVFRSAGDLRGKKRELTEGGIRVPLIVKWPKKIKPKTVTDHISAFWDFLPTVCDLIGEKPTEDADGISFLPTLTGCPESQKQHEYLYWELPDAKRQGGNRAARAGDWKALQVGILATPESPIRLYNLVEDISETNDLAERHPEKTEYFRKLFEKAHTEISTYPFLRQKITKNASSKDKKNDSSLKRPNIYWIIGEDMGPDMGCYGSEIAKTPNIDRLAKSSALYTHAYTTAPVCSASRSALMTGMYALSISAHNHRSHRDENHPLPGGVNVLTDWFRQGGYFTANLTSVTPKIEGEGKTDWNFYYPHRPFDSDSYADLKANQPFYAQANLRETHRTFRKPVRHDPAEMVYPPYYPDDPVIRRDWAAYMESMSVFDDKVGGILAWLEDEGLLEDTIVFVFGDNGAAHVRGKQWCYESGLHVPLLIRWPKNFPEPSGFESGSKNDRLIDAIDLGATSLALAGIPVPEKMQGKVFLGKRAQPARPYAFGARDRCDETVFRLRTVRDARYRYILNLTPEEPFFKTNRYKLDSYPAILRLFKRYDQGTLTPEQARIFFSPTLPAEELYDLQTDPYEMNNLVDSPEYADILRRLRHALDDWRGEVGDIDRFRFEPAELVAEVRDGASKRRDKGIRKRIASEKLEHLSDRILNDTEPVSR